MKINTKAIKEFIQTWQDQGSEVADKVTYWNSLLEILGVPKAQIDNKTYIEYEKPIKLNKNQKFHGSIDAYIPSTQVLIEQKSNGVDLSKPEERPNGGHTDKITPFEQAKRYNDYLSSKEKANFLVLSNFSQIIIYDIRESLDTKPVIIDIKDLQKDLYLLNFLVKPDNSKQLEKEKQISVAAGELVNKIYNEFANIFAKYDQTENDKITHSINTLCVRIVFCLYAEDANLFATKEQFYNYLKPIPANRCGIALKNLFKVLDTEVPDRTKNDPFWNDENPELAEFPYVNGGLFADEDIIIPPFTEELKNIILNEASRGFDWSDISPTIFGAVFESTLNPEMRRSGGMHYTSIENIHKVIDPLFLDDLKQELEDIKQFKNQSTIKRKAQEFQEKLSQLTFMDPACGSGNFLTETFLSLRRLENEAIRLELSGESVLDVGQAEDWIHVSIQQFYGIEINDFAVSVAKTALWIAEDQMMQETQDLVYAPDWNFLPLHTYTKIREGNALRMDWNKVLPNYACHFVMGNPPFVGTLLMSDEQRKDMRLFFDKPRYLDYVTCWYIKAMQYAKETKIHCAFVSTNSITQGGEVPALWPSLLEAGLKIDFAYRSFVWSNETRNNAHVHCVIIGFSFADHRKQKILFDNNTYKIVKNINPYLQEGEDLIVYPAKKPLISGVKKCSYGDIPRDGGGFMIDSETYNKLKTTDPIAYKYAHPYMMGRDFLHNNKRYCLFLENITPKEIKQSKFIQDRIKIVQQSRLSSKSKVIQKLGETPTLFKQRLKIEDNFIAIPVVSSQRRSYIPMGFLNKNIIPGNKIFVIPDGNLYDFGILESVVHTLWMKTISTRLKSDYEYSSTIVYNTFPLPSPTDKQKEKIKKTAQDILNARAKYPESTLADLYDPTSMPPELLKAHKANDRAVLQVYGLPTDASESEIVAHLFMMYEQLIQNN